MFFPLRNWKSHNNQGKTNEMLKFGNKYERLPLHPLKIIINSKYFYALSLKAKDLDF